MPKIRSSFCRIDDRKGLTVFVKNNRVKLLCASSPLFPFFFSRRLKVARENVRQVGKIVDLQYPTLPAVQLELACVNTAGMRHYCRSRRAHYFDLIFKNDILRPQIDKSVVALGNDTEAMMVFRASPLYSSCVVKGQPDSETSGCRESGSQRRITPESSSAAEGLGRLYLVSGFSCACLAWMALARASIFSASAPRSIFRSRSA